MMTIFLLTCAALVAVVLLRFALSVLRTPKKADEGTRQHNIEIARERLDELRKEREKGELSDEEFAQAREDLEIALALDLTTADATVEQKGDPRTARLTMVALVILVPLIVTGVYLRTGSPQDLGVSGPGNPMTAQVDQHQTMQGLTAELERRLNKKPDNPQGWYLLGTAYMKMKNYDGAVRAFTQLSKLLPKDPTVLVSLSDALTMQQHGKVPDQAMPLLEKALKIHPDSVSALWLAGIWKAEHGDPNAAIKYWKHAYPLISEEPEMQARLKGMIEMTAQKNGIKVEMPTSPTPTVAAAQGPHLHVAVALAPSLLGKVPPSATLFIYAKAASGPPMPLAVARMTAGDLPAKVTLDDNMAMMQQLKLSKFDKVLVGARISTSGQAMPQPGDLESSEVETPVTNTHTIDLVIDKRHP